MPELFFLKLSASSNESQPLKALADVFDNVPQKGGGKLLHAYKVVGEKLVLAVLESPSVDAADNFVSYFMKTRLLGPSRLLNVTCNAVYKCEDIFSNKHCEEQIIPQVIPDKNGDLETMSSDANSESAVSDARSVNEEQVDGLAAGSVIYWVEVTIDRSGILFSQIVKNDAGASLRRGESDGADVSVTGFKVAGEQKVHYFITATSVKSLDDLIHSLPLVHSAQQFGIQLSVKSRALRSHQAFANEVK